MTLSFDLLEDDWVPCIGLDGVPVDLSLREMLERSHGRVASRLWPCFW